MFRLVATLRRHFVSIFTCARSNACNSHFHEEDIKSFLFLSLSLPLRPFAFTQPNAKINFCPLITIDNNNNEIKHDERRNVDGACVPRWTSNSKHDSYLILSLNIFNKSCAIAHCGRYTHNSDATIAAVLKLRAPAEWRRRRRWASETLAEAVTVVLVLAALSLP